MKCDEGRPVCLKCKSFGIRCDGYGFLPRDHRQSSRVLVPADALLPRVLAPAPFSSGFQNQTEHQYFIYFKEETMPDLAGPFPSDIWQYVVLRAAHEEPLVRHLTVALAALGKSKSSVHDRSSHLQFAIEEYGRALRMIQRLIQNRSDKQSFRIALIASLLVFCFENLHGDTDQAVAHIRSALLLFRKRLALYSSPRYAGPKKLPSLPGLEDDVLHLFVKLDKDLTCHVDNSLTSQIGRDLESRSELLQIDYDDEVFRVPSSFATTNDAKDSLEQLMSGATPYLKHLPALLIGNANAPIQVPPGVYEEFDACINQWWRAFTPLMESNIEKDFIACATLQALSLATFLTVRRVCCGVEVASSFNAPSREIVALSRRMVRDKKWKRTFAVCGGIVPALFVVIMVCRTRSIREEALDILKLAEGRVEVTWDAAVLAKVGEQVLQAEDAKGYLPSWMSTSEPSFVGTCFSSF